jgi:hypothetical protein
MLIAAVIAYFWTDVTDLVFGSFSAIARGEEINLGVKAAPQCGKVMSEPVSKSDSLVTGTSAF